MTIFFVNDDNDHNLWQLGAAILFSKVIQLLF
jgi:hypothetical protein